MKSLPSTVIKSVIIYCLILIILTPSAALAQLPPPTGDWIITEPTTIKDETIILTGNLIVLSSLTLDHVTLKINSRYNGEFGIYVTSGSLTIKNGSVITALTQDEEHKYIFSVYGSHFELTDSEVSYCMLFIVQTANSIIANSHLMNNNYGIYVFNTQNVQLTGNTITSSGPQTSNLVSNSSFESASDWTPSASRGGIAKVQDSSQKHSGLYSGLTDTRNLKTNRVGYAKLVQNLNPTPVSQILNQSDSLELWIRNGGKARLGYWIVEVQVWSAEGRVLHYRWRLDGSPLPSDTQTHKYIDMGTSLPENRWTRLERNLYNDWVNLKGMPSTDKINKITLYNEGSFLAPIPTNIELNEEVRRVGRIGFCGQLINWDDVQIKYVKNDVYTSGVVLASAQSSLVQSNMVTGYQNGIFLISSNENHAADNILRNNNNGIYLFDSSNNIIENNISSGNSYAGIVVNTSDGNAIGGEKGNSFENNFIGTYFLASNGNSFKGNIISGNSYGIYFESSSYNVVELNNIQNNKLNGISLVGSSNYNRLKGNTVGNNNLAVFMKGVEQNTLTSNEITGNQLGIYLYNSSRNTLNRNNVLNNTSEGFVLTLSSNSNLLEENNMRNNGKGVFIASSQKNVLKLNSIANNDYGVWIHDSRSNEILQNNILSNRIHGVSLVESQGNTLSNNQIVGSGRINLYLESSESNTLSNNTVEECEYGIFLHKSSQNTVRNNYIRKHEINGILMTDGSDRNALEGNQMSQNRVIAIFVKNSSRNTITGNNLQNNKYGIYLYETPNNRIQENILNSNEDTGVAVTKWSDRVSVVNNEISGHIYGIFLYKSEDLSIDGNTFSNNQEDIHIPPNLVKNNGFESSSNWHASATYYGKAKVQDSNHKRAGGFSGMTDTRPPVIIRGTFQSGKSGIVTAELTQNLEQIPVSRIIDKPDSLELWLKNVGFAKDGGDIVEVQVWSAEGRVLHYRWRLDGSPLPSDTQTHKYIDMGTSLPENRWTRLERNLYNDWVNLKGMPSTDKINKITLYNEGSFRIILPVNPSIEDLNELDIDAIFKFRGQQVNWDSVYIDFYPFTP